MLTQDKANSCVSEKDIRVVYWNSKLCKLNDSLMPLAPKILRQNYIQNKKEKKSVKSKRIEEVDQRKEKDWKSKLNTKIIDKKSKGNSKNKNTTLNSNSDTIHSKEIDTTLGNNSQQLIEHCGATTGTDTKEDKQRNIDIVNKEKARNTSI